MSWLFFVKLFSSRDASIHPFVLSSINGWHHTGKKTLAEINNPPPPLRMCRCLDATKNKKNEKKDDRYLLVKKMYTNVKNEAHQNDPQLRMPCKKI
jgi:hypothetical protein